MQKPSYDTAASAFDVHQAVFNFIWWTVAIAVLAFSVFSLA